MTHALSLTMTGLTTMTLTSSAAGYLLLGYAPQEPTEGALTVTESARLYVSGSTTAQVQSRLQAIQTFFDLCKQRQQRQIGNRGYVNLQVSGEAAAHRSEILEGRLLYDEDALRHWANYGVEVTLIWTRRFYWEGPEAEATNGSVTVYNHSIHPGTTTTNKVPILGSRVTGTIPAACRIEMTNNTGGAAQYGEIYIGHNVFATSLIESLHTLQAELSSGGTVSDATCSSGQRKDLSLDTSWGEKASYAVGSWFAGLPYVVLLRLGTAAPAGSYVKAQIYDWQGLATLVEGPEVLLAGTLQSLGTFALPPALPGVSSLRSCQLTIYARNAFGAATLQADYFQLTPTNGFRKLRTIRQGSNWEIANGDKLVDDGIEGSSYVETDVSSVFLKNPLLTGQGELLLYPGRDQTLYFLHTAMDGTSAIGRTLGVRVYYRPRRLSL